MDTQELIQEIQEAFASRSYPGDDRIARRRPDGIASEADETWERFRGKDWGEMVAVGREHDLRENISFLTFEGFVYYLPAYLTLALRPDAPLDIDEFVASHLWAFPGEISPLLRPAERRAVVHALELLAREFDSRKYVTNDAQTALDHYWAYFTDEELGLSTGHGITTE
ncbi:MAG TPA: DUF6714 family protein [Thermoanaerobaculia bacterium]|jgi:hypothetical protein|nr:DUF6714 family protein [Thermoanaerobaculia bacterium]